MESEAYFCIQLKLTMKSRTCENEGESWERLAFDLVFLIVFYVINRAILVLNLNDSSYFHHVGQLTLHELYHNLKVSIYIRRQVLIHVHTDFFVNFSFLIIDIQTCFLLLSLCSSRHKRWTQVQLITVTFLNFVDLKKPTYFMTA